MSRFAFSLLTGSSRPEDSYRRYRFIGAIVASLVNVDEIVLSFFSFFFLALVGGN